MEPKEPFWMVYGLWQGAPTFKHETPEAAKTEAERLARMCPGTTFYVLQTVARARKHDVEFHPIVYRGLVDDLPF
jgi:hypothetical protein